MAFIRGQRTIVPPVDVLPPAQVLTTRWIERNLSPILWRRLRTIRWLAIHQLISNNMQCGGCVNVMMTFCRCAQSGDRFVWRCRLCKSKTTIRRGSFFAGSHLPLWKIITMVYKWCFEVPQRYIMREVSLTRNETMVEWANVCRNICIHWYHNADPIELGGMDDNNEPRDVEIDETFYFHRKYHRGARHGGKWVFGAVERGSGRCLLQEVVHRDAATLLPIIQRNILPGTRIISDGWAAYRNISNINNGQYVHEIVNHRVNFVDPIEPTIHTQTIEGLWQIAKAKLRRQHGTSRHLFPTYIYEIMWRRNCCYVTQTDAFSSFLVAINERYPV